MVSDPSDRSPAAGGRPVPPRLPPRLPHLYAPCPKCGARDASKVSFTWWGGLVGPRMFHVVRCRACDASYNGRTGGKLTATIVVYQIIAALVVAVILLYLFKLRMGR